MNVQSKPAAAKPWPTPGERNETPVDPIILQIVEGTLNSIEAEIEYAIERTARSPMIREAHDYRVGLFDRYCRKLTGRSYSAMPNAVVRDFPPQTMRGRLRRTLPSRSQPFPTRSLRFSRSASAVPSRSRVSATATSHTSGLGRRRNFPMLGSSASKVRW